MKFVSPVSLPSIAKKTGDVSSAAEASTLGWSTVHNKPLFSDGKNWRVLEQTDSENKIPNLLIYYGYPIAYKGLWDVQSVVADISANYNIYVCGDTYQAPTHSEYATTTQIIAGLRANGVKVYGYVPIGGATGGANRTAAVLKTAIDQWVTLNVDGIFLDEFGFDYGVTRSRQIDITNYVISKGLPYCANSWVFEEFACDTLAATGFQSGDWKYTQYQTGNPTGLALTRRPGIDSYLIENFCYGNTGITNFLDTQQRVHLIKQLNATTGAVLWAVGVLPESPAASGNIDFTKTGNLNTVKKISDYLYAQAQIFQLDAIGLGGFSFGSNGTPIDPPKSILPFKTKANPSYTYNSSTYQTSRYFDTKSVTVSNNAGVVTVSVSGDTNIGAASTVGSFNTILTSGAAPTSAMGADGDYCIVIDANGRTLYGPKTSGSWGTGYNLKGADGAAGSPGSQGPAGPAATFLNRGVWNPAGAQSSAPGMFGLPPLTAVGAATTRNPTTSNMFTRMKRIGYVSAATAGSFASVRIGAVMLSLGVPGAIPLGGFEWKLVFGCADAATVAGARQFCGIGTHTAAPTNVEPSTMKNCIGVGHGAADTNLKLYHSGPSKSGIIDLGVNFPANTLSTDIYEVYFRASNTNNNSVDYKVTRLNTGHTTSGTITSATPGYTLPSNLQLMTPAYVWRTNNTTAKAVALDIMGIDVTWS